MKNCTVKIYLYSSAFMVALILTAVGFINFAPNSSLADNHPNSWSYEWPDTDFSNHSVAYSDILSGGPPKDGIPSIDNPQFMPVSEFQQITPMADTEPVIGLIINGEAKAYPLSILTWHEIVNDEIGGVPVTVTFCPLCNSAIVFDRRLDGQTLDFGTTGKLRNSDLVMYDRQTETWWQQFLGEGIIGKLTGARLNVIPSRMESWKNFRTRAPDGKILVPNNADMRNYGRNPYVGYDSASMPFLYKGDMPKDINPMIRVVAIGDQAWTLDMLRKQGPITENDMVISWSEGQNSALDTGTISKGKDVGNVLVQRKSDNGEMLDLAHDVTFAFVFHAFRPNGVIHK